MIIQRNKNFGIILALLLACGLSGCAGLVASLHSNYTEAQTHEHIRKGEYRAVISELTQAIAVKPDIWGYYVNRGVAYTLVREYDNALVDYRRAIALQPEKAVTHLNYVGLLIYLRRTPEAEEYARGFLRAHPQSLLMKLGLAAVLEAQQRYAEVYELTSAVLPKLETSAGEDELKYVAKDSLLARAYLSHGLAAAGLRKTNEASKAMGKAAIYRNDIQTSYSYYQARIHYIQGNWQQAVDELIRGYARATTEENDSPSGMESRFLLGNSYFKLGDMAQARDAYEQFLSANKFEPEAFYNLGQAFAESGDKRRAIENYSSAIQLRRDFIAALTNRGTLYLEAKQYPNAILDFAEVLTKQPRDTRVLYKRAYSLCMGGNRSEGRKDLTTILRIEPGNGRAKLLLTQCGRG